MRHILTVFTTILLLAMAGCGDDQPEQAEEPTTQSEPASTDTATDSGTEPASTDTATESASEPASTETATESTSDPASTETAQDTETVTNNACLEAAKEETGESDIEVTSNEFSEANTLVMLGVGADRAPWKCVVSSDGQVAELSFEGDDSAGTAPSSTD
jgi:hypothetical protein